MTFLVIAYIAVWLGVFAYMFKLASDSRRMQQQLATMEEIQKDLQRQMQAARMESVGSAD